MGHSFVGIPNKQICRGPSGFSELSSRRFTRFSCPRGGLEVYLNIPSIDLETLVSLTFSFMTQDDSKCRQYGSVSLVFVLPSVPRLDSFVSYFTYESPVRP